MNDRFNKYSNDPINKDREEKENIELISRDTNRENIDTDHEDVEKKGFLDKIMDFFSPDDDPDRNRDQKNDLLDRDDTFIKSEIIRDPLYTPGRNTRNTRDTRDTRNTRDTGMMESDRDSDDSEKVLVGIFDTENEAINVITRLNQIGYWEDDITAIAKDKHQAQEGTVNAGAGEAVGGSLGGLAVALPALGLIEIPGTGQIHATGPMTGALGDGVTGGLVGGLVQLGVREEDAKEYIQYIQQGKILILVENRDHIQEDVNSTFLKNNSLISDRSRIRELAGRSL